MKIAIVEDDINMRKSLEFAFDDYDEYDIVSFNSATKALKAIDDTYDLILTDINMPKMNGIEFIKELYGKYEIIIMTGNATLNYAIDSIKLGVKDFITKPFEIDTLIDAIKRSKKIISSKPTKKINIKNKKLFYSTSDELEKTLKIASKAAKSRANIMLLGESGVGKELFAKYIHQHGGRDKKPFVAINMAAIPEHLLESELFGFLKGAFTDATKDKLGLVEQANGGTLFLDEIAEMPYVLQAKLLRVLQEKEITPLGSTKSKKIDIQILSATNVNIQQSIDKKEFREDLYFRLSTIPLQIAPLRKRKEEILEIAQEVLKEQDNTKQFSNEAKNSLLEYNWPGNIRELISVVQRSAILSEKNEITSNDLFLNSRVVKKESKVETLEKSLIKELLDECEQNTDAVAIKMGINPIILKEKIKKYGL